MKDMNDYIKPGMYEETELEEMLNKYKDIVIFHHTAYAQGYIPVNKALIMQYHGRFGIGYTIDRHSNDSTRYMLRSYYILEK